MKLLWRMGKEAVRYRSLYVIAILSTFALTVINLAAPRGGRCGARHWIADASPDRPLFDTDPVSLP